MTVERIEWQPMSAVADALNASLTKLVNQLIDARIDKLIELIDARIEIAKLEGTSEDALAQRIKTEVEEQMDGLNDVVSEEVKSQLEDQDWSFVGDHVNTDDIAEKVLEAFDPSELSEEQLKRLTSAILSTAAEWFRG